LPGCAAREGHIARRGEQRVLMQPLESSQWLAMLVRKRPGSSTIELSKKDLEHMRQRASVFMAVQLS